MIARLVAIGRPTIIDYLLVSINFSNNNSYRLLFGDNLLEPSLLKFYRVKVNLALIFILTASKYKTVGFRASLLSVVFET